LNTVVRRHLDLGCGTRPRNPYGCEELYGIDIRDGLTAPGVMRIVAANLSLEPIPFPDNTFDSLSAYDFLEHVPRVALDHANGRTHFPFVQLMNDVWRVLKPGGVFYAVTPAYPHEKAFRDPTHVNVIAAKSHRYFTRPELGARMYGFEGDFRLIRQNRIHIRGDYEPRAPGLGRRLLRLADGLVGKRSHLVWEMEALKPSAPPVHV
jgi:SAM-dependent methyltransferase